MLFALFRISHDMFLCAGHEAAFAAFLCCLCKVGALRMEDQLAIVFKVFDKLVALFASLLILNITFHCSQVRSATTSNFTKQVCTLLCTKYQQSNFVSVFFCCVLLLMV